MRRSIWIHVALVIVSLMAFSFVAPQNSRADEETLVTASFNGVRVGEILKLLSEKGELDMVLHSDVKGTITLFLTDVTVKEALDAVFETADLAYVKENDIYFIMQGMRYEEIYGTPFQLREETRVIALEYTDPSVLLPSIQQIRSKNGKVFADRNTNSLIVIDRPEIVGRIEKMIRNLDQPREIRSFDLENAGVESVLAKIQPFLSAGSKTQIDTDGNRLMVQDTAQGLEQISFLVSEFDRMTLLETRFFELAHTHPEAVLNVLTPELTPDHGRIISDEKTNAVIVTDFPGQLDHFAELIAALDVRTPEVLIDAKIIQITLSDNLKLGVNWQAISNKLNGLDISGTFNVLAPGDSGLRIDNGDLERDNYNLIVEALATVGNSNLLSNPRILALNNQEASILVGSTIPYTTTDTREEGGAIRTFEVVTYVDVGVKLNVTPRIHNKDLVSIKVEPEVSSVIAFSGNIPVVKTSKTMTTVMVRNGETAIIAGLIEDEEIEKVSKIPLLGDIPLLGFLFRSTDKTIEKRELVILLTPHIVMGEEDEVWLGEGKK